MRCLTAMFMGVAPEKGAFPVSISYATMPSE
jgi:hypothetical protein